MDKQCWRWSWHCIFYRTVGQTRPLMMSRFSPGVSWFPWEPSFQVTNLLFFQSFSLHGPVHKWVREQQQSRSSGKGFLWGTAKKMSWKRKERCEWQREAGHGLDLKKKKEKEKKSLFMNVSDSFSPPLWSAVLCRNSLTLQLSCSSVWTFLTS